MHKCHVDLYFICFCFHNDVGERNLYLSGLSSTKQSRPTVSSIAASKHINDEDGLEAKTSQQNVLDIKMMSSNFFTFWYLDHFYM